MTLHPQLQAMLDKAAGLPPLHTLTVEAIRATDLKRYDIGVPKEAVAAVEDRTIAGPRGPIRLRLYRPSLMPGASLTMFFHGSGFCICSIETHDAMCRQICRRADTLVVSVDYRLAPEHKFPAGPDDCYAAVLWAHAHAAEIGGDPARMAVCGDSAGGTMAAVVAQRARDENGPALRAQVLLYPVTDHYSAGHASFIERGTGYGLTAEGMRYFWELYLAEPREGNDPRASPLRAASLRDLPATYLIVGDYDLLRDEGTAYARRLSAEGVQVTFQHYSEMNHAFLNWVGLLPESGKAMDTMCGWLRDQLERR